MEVHVVQKGDTLWKISRQYGISFEELKRVNAHLANPDYVVPGMKIFLPDKVKKPDAGGGQIKKPEKAPVKKPTVPKEEVEIPKPKPKPEVRPPAPPVESKPAPPKPQPKPEPEQSKPKPTPEPEQSKPKPTPKPEQSKPKPPKEPLAPPVQSQPMPPPTPMQPYPSFPVIGIPCGWLPIYDADCYPHMHPSQIQPMPSPMPQLPVQLESSHFPGHHLPTKPMKPTKPKITDDWKLVESPMIEEEFIVQEPKVPKHRPTSTPERTPIPLPQRQPQHHQIPLPQAVEPMSNNNWGCMHCGGQPSHPAHSLQCGCGGIQPVLMPMPMPQHHGHCNACHQPIQNIPQMMPFPPQNNNWYGMH